MREHKLKPVDAAGVARMIEEGARLADDREKLSIEIGRMSDIVREADYWATREGREVITREDIVKPIEEAHPPRQPPARPRRRKPSSAASF